jgi:hypothetical protein
MSTVPISNAPTRLSMVDFHSMMDLYGGLAKSCRFAAMIKPSGSYLQRAASSTGVMRDLTYLCEATEFPGRGFENVDLYYGHGPKFKLPFQTNYEDINMTFICRAESLERQFFDDWMAIMNPNNTFDFNYRDEYCAEIELFHYQDISETGYPEPIYTFTLLKAYPVLVSPQPVTWADEQFMRLGVTFTYTWWTRKLLDNSTTTTDAATTKDFNLVTGFRNTGI